MLMRGGKLWYKGIKGMRWNATRGGKLWLKRWGEMWWEVVKYGGRGGKQNEWRDECEGLKKTLRSLIIVFFFIFTKNHSQKKKTITVSQSWFILTQLRFTNLSIVFCCFFRLLVASSFLPSSLNVFTYSFSHVVDNLVLYVGIVRLGGRLDTAEATQEKRRKRA